MIKKPASKEQQRREIDAQIEAFLRAGSEVDEVPRGVSGRDFADGALRTEPWQSGEKKSDRTYLPDVVDTLEKRRRDKTAHTKAIVKNKKPHRRLIYDDFGEPLRWVWVDE